MLKRKYIAVLLGAFLIGCGDPSAFDLNEKLNENNGRLNHHNGAGVKVGKTANNVVQKLPMTTYFDTI